MVVTVAVYLAGTAARNQVATGEFRRLTGAGVEVLRTRMQGYMQTVQGTASFMRASGDMTRRKFGEYVEHLESDRFLPELGAIGFIQSVPSGDLDAYLSEVRADEQPGYVTRNLTAGDTHYLVRYIYPRVRHQGALGLDLMFEPERRAALEAARDTGTIQLTLPIDLITYQKEAAGFLLVLPYLGRAIPEREDAAAEKGAFIGWVYTLFTAENLMADLTANLGESYSYRLYDGPTVDPDRLILQAGQMNGPAGAFDATYKVEKFGRPWTIVFASTARFDRAFHSYQPSVTLFIGVILTVLTLFLLRARRRRSEALSEIALLRARQVVAREEENRAIVENDVTSVFVLDAMETILFVNRASLMTFGYVGTDIAGLRFGALVREASPGVIPQSYNALGHPREGDALFLDQQRNEWTTVDGQARVTAIVRDVTGQIRAQSELKRTKTLYDMALNGAQIGVYDLDIATATTDVSQTWCEIMGCPANCNDGDTMEMFWARVHPADLPVLQAAEDACANGKTDAAIAEYRVRFGKDDWRWMRSHSMVVEREDDGKALRLIGMQSDVTDLVQARYALEASEQMFRQALAAAPVGMALMDARGNFKTVNEAFCVLCGRDEAEILGGTRLADLMPSEDIKAVYRGAGALTEVGASQVYIAEHRILHSNGNIRWGLCNISWTHDRNTDQNFYIAQINDITDQKKMDQVKNEFVATVSHELRTPLTSIKGALELIKAAGKEALPVAAARLIDIASSNTDRLVGIVNDILDLEKISSGEVAFNFGEICMCDLVRTGAEEMGPFAMAYDNRLKIDVPPEPVFIVADGARIKQVLANLVSNACKYSSANSDVLIKVERLGDVAIVYVQNIGPGVPEVFKSKIFKAFSQADSSDTRAKGGTGLGLNITRQIVGRHGGDVGFKSRPGGITVFWFTCPVAAMQRVPDRQSIVQLPSPDAKRIKVLHFEKDRDFAEVTALTMAPVADVQHAAARDAAHEVLGRTRLDALIVDCTMPDEDVADLLDAMALRQPEAVLIGLSADEDRMRDPRLLIDLIKSRSELGTIVTSVMRCLTRVS